MTQKSKDRKSSGSDTQRGRPSGTFSDSSDRSKRRKTEHLRSSYETNELAYATQMKLRSSGAAQASNVVKEVTSTSPSRASKYQSAYRQSLEKPLCEISADLALNLLISGKMTKETYQMTRMITNKNRGCSVFPAYKKILSAKNRCYPPSSAISISETSAEVELQPLLEHTTARLLQCQEQVIASLDSNLTNEMTLFLKWGCDGSSGQEYKQKFRDEDSSDAHVFFTSIVPLRLFAKTSEGRTVIIWNNLKPSSPRFCRPIRLQFLKESVQSTLFEKNYVEKQIENLIPFDTVLSSRNIRVHYKLAFTMVDGKVKNAITGTTSAMRCYVCKFTSKNFNDLDLFEKEVEECNLQFGIGSLHAWIRFMEWFLHLAYKNIEDGSEKKWQARSVDAKQNVKARKEEIQNDFWKELGLRIDIPKAGAGSTNDGNTARRFFENVPLTAKILRLGLDEGEELIENCKVVLQAMSCGFDINIEKFKNYCRDIARKYVQLYKWYPMPTSVHIVLIHGHAIINAAALPIGQLSEDAQEARNKDIKKSRENFARKSSRAQTMEDVFKRLLASSDPVISSLQKMRPKKSDPLSPKVLELLVSSSACKPMTDFYAVNSDSECSDEEM